MSVAISIFTTAQPPLRPLTENSHYQFSKPNEKMRLKNPFMTLSVHLVIIANLKFKKNYIQSNLAIRNFLVTLKLFLNAKSYPYEANGKLVTGNGSLIPYQTVPYCQV